jgi:hypothetical protein
MTCPREVTAILLEIVHSGLLNARLAGWSGNAAQAATEADHVHNLPDIIADYTPGRLRYYWEVERTCYLANPRPVLVASFQDHWDRLRPHIEPFIRVAAAG